jgi:Sulfatase
MGDPGSMRALPSYPVRLVHLLTVWAFGVSQPVFSMLDANPEFLVVRGSTRIEVVMFAVVLALGPPFLAILCTWLVSLASRVAADVLYLVFLGLFVAPLGLMLLSTLDPHAVAAVVGFGAFGSIVAIAYARWRPVRTVLTVAFVLPVVGFAVFVTGIPLVVDDVAGARVRAPNETPVVVVVLDELPTSSLLTTAGEVDPVRYPSFARLASRSTWYPRATTVHEHTVGAVPALLTGRLPEGFELPTLEDHPQNLFTLLGESFRMRVHEAVTYLCPTRYCPRDRQALKGRVESLAEDVRIAYLHLVLPDSLQGGLPEIGDRWGDLNRERLLAAEDVPDLQAAVHDRSQDHEARVMDFLQDMSPHATDRRLHFLHLVLPHSPWQFLPTGHHYAGEFQFDGRDGDATWLPEPWPVVHGYQRHLLQVGFVDRMLGQFLRRFGGTRFFDRAVVVVVADHGANFTPGHPNRRVAPGNVADVARVPLFVKFPRQTRGRVDSRPVQTIDILPTIADVLDVRIPWQVDGRSLLTSNRRPADVQVAKREGEPVTASHSEVDRQMAATVRRKRALFGEGSESLYELGASRGLLGTALASLGSLPTQPGAGVTIDDEASFGNVQVRRIVPARVTGAISGTVPPGSEIAVAVNGRVAAIGGTYRRDRQLRFSAMVPPWSFMDGRNTVEVLLVVGRGSNARLVRLPLERDG